MTGTGVAGRDDTSPWQAESRLSGGICPASLRVSSATGCTSPFLSNGALIGDEDRCLHCPHRPLRVCSVSVDGSCAKVHDSCRGQGSFDGAIRGIRTLQRHRINVAVRVTVHRNNVHDLENVAHFLLDELGLPNFGTNSARYMENVLRERG